MVIQPCILLVNRAMRPLLVSFSNQRILKRTVSPTKTTKAKRKITFFFLCKDLKTKMSVYSYFILFFCRPLHLAAPLGMMDVTETLLAKGASVTAVDGRNLSPPLACAPNEDVATCLAMILSVFLATPANSEARRSICSLSKQIP